MNKASQAIATVKREVQLVEWQRQMQERQEQGITVDAWCARLGISKGAYYRRLRKVREYMCTQMGLIENDADATTKETPQATAVVPIRPAPLREKAAIEMQLGELQIRFNENPDAEQLKVVLAALTGANKPVC